MPNPLDNEKSVFFPTPVRPQGTVATKPFPQPPYTIRTKNPQIQKDWKEWTDAVEQWSREQIAAIPDGSAQVADLQSRVEALESKIAQLLK